MTIEYDLTVDDMIALTQYHSDRSPRERFRRRIVQGLLVLVFLLLLFSAVDSIRKQGAGLSPGWIAASSVPLVCPTILLVLVFSGAVRRWSNSRSVHKTFGDRQPEDVIAHHQLSLTGDGIHVRSNAGEMIIEWPDILDITKTDTHVLVFGAAEQALAVPRRAFTGQQDFDEFADRLRRLRSLSAPTPA